MALLSIFSFLKISRFDLYLWLSSTNLYLIIFISSIVYCFFGLPINALIQSNGIADIPIPPNKTNKNHDRNDTTPMTYIGNETFNTKSDFSVLQFVEEKITRESVEL